MSERAQKINALPPLRDVIKTHGLSAKKAFGQNFLLDLNLTDKIARQAGNLSGVNAIEIGPGPGGLTRALLKTEATHVYAIEKDPRCITALQDLVDMGDLTLLEQDALDIDLIKTVPAPRAVIANLPYNIGTPLLLGWLKQIDEFESLTLMFQDEVARRIVAEPRTKAYGRLSILCQFLCETNIAMTLPASAFTPPPKVDSAVIHLRPKTNRDRTVHIDKLERLTAAAFGQRRKMVRQSLKPVFGENLPHILAQADIKETARAEELTLDDFVTLTKLAQIN